MLLKTDRAHQQALLDCLKSHHPYQTPNYWFYPSLTETLITSHGSTHHYADSAAVQHIRFRRLI
jgi:hypothetical protein